MTFFFCRAVLLWKEKYMDGDIVEEEDEDELVLVKPTEKPKYPGDRQTAKDLMHTNSFYFTGYGFEHYKEYIDKHSRKSK